jgi:DNA-binding transcriptional LysR family regulator
MGAQGRCKWPKRLAVSPPSVSKAISHVQHAIGMRLLTPKGVELTAYGRALLRHGMGAFDELRQGIRTIKSLSDPSVGKVRTRLSGRVHERCGFRIIDRFSD